MKIFNYYSVKVKFYFHASIAQLSRDSSSVLLGYFCSFSFKASGNGSLDNCEISIRTPKTITKMGTSRSMFIHPDCLITENTDAIIKNGPVTIDTLLKPPTATLSIPTVAKPIDHAQI